MRHENCFTFEQLDITMMNCGDPPALSAATYVVVRNVVTYTCNQGYKMVGDADKVTCQAENWVGTKPECQFQENSAKIYNLTNAHDAEGTFNI